MSTRTVIFAFLALSLANATSAQDTGWTVAPMDGGRPAARTQVSGNTILFAAACSGETPGGLLVIKNDFPGAKVKLDILADSGTSSLAIEKTTQAHVWATVLDRATLDILSKGSAAELIVSGSVQGSLSLAGSQVALNKALGACMPAGAGVASTTPPSVRVSSLPAAALSAWRASCRGYREGFEPFRPGPGTHVGEFLGADLNGDGVADFAISVPEGICDGQPSDVIDVHFLLSSGQSYRVLDGFSGRSGLVGTKRCGSRDVILAGDPVNTGVWGFTGGKIDFLGKEREVSCAGSGSAQTVVAKPSSPAASGETGTALLRVNVGLTPKALATLGSGVRNVDVHLCFGPGCDAGEGPTYGEEEKSLPVSGGTAIFVQKPRPDPQVRRGTVPSNVAYALTVDAKGADAYFTFDCSRFGKTNELHGQSLELKCGIADVQPL